MERIRLFAVLCVTLCLTGCLSTEVAQSEVCGVEHIMVRDYGWKLFNCIPIFRRDITTERVQAALFEEAGRLGKTPAHLAYRNEETILLEIPIIGFTVPIPYLVCAHEIQLSGVLQ